MKLTNIIRDAFVRAAINDVPLVDYDELMRSTAMSAAVAALPPAVRKLWNDKATQAFVHLEHTYFGDRDIGRIGVCLPAMRGETLKLPDDTVNEIRGMLEKRQVQAETVDQLKRDLRAVAYSHSTRKALVAALPEFERYLPEDEAKALRTVPAIANVVSSFAKAGWPKDKVAA